MKVLQQPKSAALFCDAEKISQVMGVSKTSPINWFKSGQLAGVQFGKVVRFPIAETAAKLGIKPEDLK